TFVPNFALNMDVMRAVRKVCALPLDVHLMIESPERYLARFVEAGATYLTVHQEATRHLQRVLGEIRALGARVGVALNPATPLNTLDYVLEDLDLLLIMTVNPGFSGQKLVPAMLRKIAEARAMVKARGLEMDIEVDGNVSFEAAPRMVQAGANILVGGTSSLFRPGASIQENAARLRQVVLEG
ncbi:MAG: ribulose-phosphate 3-epimerase, partial [Chloroflexi bacterium]|nr:ribulose-phosphate 3-epimerase [Chloroflexota bacterium]